MKKIFNIISGAKSGALNIAMLLAKDFVANGYDVKTIFRKYNKTDIAEAIVVKDRCTIDYICGLARLLQQEQPDIIIVHGYSTHIWTKLALKKSGLAIKLIHVEHNAERYTGLRSWLTKKLDAYTDKYICVSKGVADNLLQQGVDPAKVQVIYNGIDIPKYAALKKQPHDIFTIGMTARFSNQKDQLTLIKAVGQLVKQEALPLKLILLGEGKTKAKCQSYVQEQGLADSIEFKTGKFTDLIPQLDLFVLATHYEGLPLVVCEAMAAGLPVIASDVVGCNEIVQDNKAGWLVAEGASLELAKKIDWYRKLPAEEKQQSINAMQQMVREKFALEKMLAEYRAVLSSLE